MRKILFKQLTESDLELLHQWFQVPHVKQCYARGEVYTKAMIREKYLTRIVSEHIPSFIIYADEQPIGYIQYYKVSESLPDGVTSYEHQVFGVYDAKKMAGIDLFIADVNCLGKGVSSDALRLFIVQYLQQNFVAVVVDPLKSNHHAIAFFTRNKFEKFIDTDGNHELMILEL